MSKRERKSTTTVKYERDTSMFKRSLLIGVTAAAFITGTASAHQTNGEFGGEVFEDGSVLIARWQENSIVRDAESGTIQLVTYFEDGSQTWDRIDIASDVDRYAQ